MEKILTKIDTKEYKETTNPDEVLFTEDLGSCVCLGLMADIYGMRKRGLAHIYFSGDVSYVNKKPFSWSREDEKRTFAEIGKVDEKRILSTLEEISKQFRKSDVNNGEFIPLDKINSYVIANRKKEAGISVNGDFGYSNPAFDLISNWVIKKGMILKLSDSNLKSKNEANKEDKRIYQIARKSVGLKDNGIVIIYKNPRDTWLNPKSCFKHF